MSQNRGNPNPPNRKFDGKTFKGGAPKGSNNRVKNKPWRDALKRVVDKDPDALDKVAVMLIKAAQNGDMQAVRELGDRLDGKAIQQVDSKIEVNQPQTDIPPRAASVEEWVERRKGDLGAAAGTATIRH